MPSLPVQKILIIGSGPVRIGKTGAFDDAACRACDVFKQAGLQTVMVHCDPSALAADMETADRTYMAPLTLQALTEIILREKPDALLPTVGGPTALGLAKECHPGEIGQWINGKCEVVGGGPWSATKLTADFVYPKPAWPALPPPK